MTDNLCSIPWTGFSNEPNGKAQPCCLYKGNIEKDGNPMYVQNYTVQEIFQSEYMKELRQRFRLNQKPNECQVCWTDEQNGYQSKRLVYRNHVHNKLNLDFSKEPEIVQELQLIISNSCNLKCRSCTPSHSSKWQNEFKIITGNIGYDMPYQQPGDEKSVLWNDRKNWYKYLSRLEVVGGEPFFVKQWHQIFQELSDLGYSKNIDITMTTNCTLFFPDLVKLLYKNFKSVSIGLSIDGIGSVYEYLRHPAKWEVALINIEKYYTFIDTINLQLIITIGWLNALEVLKLHDLVYSKFPKLQIWNNLIHSPEFMALWAAPTLYKDKIESAWTSFDWDQKYINVCKSMLSFMRSRELTEDEFKINISKINNVDSFRKESLTLSIPDIKEYIL